MQQNFINKEIEALEETNIKKLKSLFPNVIKDGQVDFDELKNELGIFEEVTNEKYEFSWVGKQKAKQDAQSAIGGITLKYCPNDSKDPDTTENLYIEGDNLKVLKLLRNNYTNKVKLIYIDPPYNTGNDSFIYPDSYKVNSKEIEEQLGITENGEKNINIRKDNWYKNTKESNMYHSTWMSMMYSRIRIAWELLEDEGAIFISINDIEQSNLKKICDEIFGEFNFVSQIAWQNLDTVKNDSKYFSNNYEYILVYAKNIENLKIQGIKKGKKQEAYYKNYDNDPRGSYLLTPLHAKSGTDTGRYSYKFSNGQVWHAPDGTYPRFAKETLEKLDKEGRIYLDPNKQKTPQKKTYLSEVGDRMPPTTFWDYNSYGSTRKSNKEISDLIGKGIFQNPKPVKLIENLIDIIDDNKNGIILDFFSGSSTTAHSVMSLNSKDGGKRKFIMIQIPEKCEEKSDSYKAGYGNICEIGKERIRRAGDEIKNKTGANIDYGFKVFKLDETNINWEKEEFKKKIDDYIVLRTETEKEELLKDFVEGSKDIDIVYELMLRYYGMPLSAKINKLNKIGNRTYSVDDTIIVCLEDFITNRIVDEIAEVNFDKLYLRDSSFKGDKSLEIKENLMIRLNLQKEYKDEKSYRVEFI